MGRKIAAHYALIEGELRRNIVVEVDDMRQIVSITQTESLDNMASVEFHPGILIPGMINLHCHLELSYLRGSIAEGSGFAGFARAIGQVRGNFSTEQRIRAASLWDSVMWQEGVEAVLDIANDDLVMGVKEQSQIEYHTLFEAFGLGLTSLESHKKMAQNYNHSTLTPHSTYSLQDSIFREACISNNSTISIHLLESRDEIELYDNRGSLAQWYQRMGWECDFLSYGSPARRVAESVASNRRTVCVHGCMATADDIALLDSHFQGGVTWALCPESNRFISRIKPPVELLRSLGARVGIGTDSLASARSLSMIDNMRQLGDIPLAELLTWATLNGARALGIDDRMGEIAVGKRPGLVIIEGADLSSLRLTEQSYARRLV